MRSRRNLAVLGLLCLAGVLAWAQTATTSLRGTVSDSRGAVLPEATVTLTNPDTGFSRMAKTDGQGVYQFLQVAPGTYSVSASATGFSI